MTSQPATPRTLGFSLVEMISVVAIIGILTAFAIAAISKINENAKVVSAKRNAQQAAAMSACVEAAGITHVVPEPAGGIEATLAGLSSGISAVSDTGTPVYFQLSLSESEIADAAKFLSLNYTDGGRIMMLYASTGAP